jgi:glycine oxidase
MKPDQNRSSESSVSRPSVGIIGAGVSGLGIGWRLAAAGCKVDVYDRAEQPGRAASWAAAGMLAASAEAEPGEEMLLALDLTSQAMWPGFAAELAAASGITVEYRDEGILIVALDRDDAEALRFNYDYQRGQGLNVEWLSGRDARKREPFLSPNVCAGVYSPGDHQVENRRLVDALVAAYRAAGGTLITGTEVAAVDIEAGRVRGLVLAGEAAEHRPYDMVVIAAGAWSRAIEGLPAELRPPVRPLKGQMLAVQMDPRDPLLRHVVWAPGVYLVPRNDGRLLIGATVEEKGFDATLTAGGMLDLLRDTWEALPGVTELPIVETWVGHRPSSRDDAPILGPTPVEGLVMATGHHRNGILLAPVTADAVSHYILTGEVMPAIAPFSIDRFARKANRHRPAAADAKLGAKLGIVS